MLSRRTLIGCACGLVGAPLWRTARAATPSGGCGLRISSGLKGFAAVNTPPDESESDLELFNDTGQADLNQALGRAVGQIAHFFGVSPAVGLYDDMSEPNAYAYPKGDVAGAEALVAIGSNLLQTQLKRRDNGVSMVAVVAHEFGHILQYENPQQQSRLIGPSGEVVLAELNADFFAGLYLANYHARNPDIEIAETGRVFYGLGDTNFGDTAHHGTPEQRVKAIEFGFLVGNAQPRLRPRDALREAVNYVRDQFGR